MAVKVRQILDMNAFDAAVDAPPDGEADTLLARRQANFGAASVLFYARPITMVRAAGSWMEAADGTRYLDFYNNVPSVGHCHPRVVAAISRQAATLNTNTRYLVEVVESYLERLKATLPSDLSNLALSCSGSEANDLALRIARKVAGAHGVIVTEAAYHGNTAAVTEISPGSYKRGGPPDFVAMVPAPGREAYGDDIAGGFAAAVAAAVARLEADGHGVAAFICDSIFSSDGVFADPPGLLAPAVEAVHRAGGLYIADEVQPGFGRTGAALWGFERHGVAPDIVTMGKPMGNGFPMAGLATRPAHLAAFCEDFGYFNTFGGNPVAAAAGRAVLEVIEEEGLIANADRTGRHLMERLADIAAADPRVLDVRGAGLFIGVDLGRPAGGKGAGRTKAAPRGEPDPALAKAVINGLKERRILIGAAGKFGHTLKVRPPLCLSMDDADFFCDGFAATLRSIPDAA